MENRNFLYSSIILALIVAFGAGYYFFGGNRMPNLDRPFTPRADLPESIQKEASDRVAAATQGLRENPDTLVLWLELAVYRKGANDLEGAEEIWLYAVQKWPEDPVAYNNLADLYQNYLNNYTKAEVYWRKLIERTPRNTAAYRNLSDLYRYKLDDLQKARAILEEGLEKNPNHPDLVNYLASLPQE